MLATAIRFLIVQQRLEVLRATQPEIDASSVEAQIQRIRTALKRVTNINTHLGSLRKSSDAIASEVDSLKLEIKDALDSMEDAIR